MKKNIYSLIAILGLSGLSYAQPERVTLVETFTSSTCPPCNPGNVALEGLLADPQNEGKYVSLKYQMSWPGSGDPYFTTEGDVRRGLYSVLGVPNTEVDAGFNDNPSSLGQNILDAAYAVAPKMDIQAYYQINEATQTVDMQIDLEALTDISYGNRMFVAIYEFTTYNNVKSNGETSFEHVMKKMIPGASGTVLTPMVTSDTRHYDLSYTFQGNYRLPADATDEIDHGTEHSVEEFSDLGVVVWVQSMSGAHEVFQANNAIMGAYPLSVEENEAILSAKIYPNPAVNTAAVAFHVAEPQDVTIKVYDMLGQVISTAEVNVAEAGRMVYTLNTEKYTNGMYTVSISSDMGSISKRLLIEK